MVKGEFRPRDQTTTSPEKEKGEDADAEPPRLEGG
jgi:hypothetical protein